MRDALPARLLPVVLVAAVLGTLPTAPAQAADRKQITVLNPANSGKVASSLHMSFSNTGNDVHVRNVKVHPNAGNICPPRPLVTDSSLPPATNSITINWGVDCVDPGEKVTFELRTAHGPIAAGTTQWTNLANETWDGVVTITAAVPATDRSPVDWGCGFTAVRDVTDEQGQETWIEATYSYFVGTPDTTSFRVTCWLQTSATFGEGQLDNTRHTCGGEAPVTVNVCVNPVLFEINSTDNVYFCTHVEWTAATSIHYPQTGDQVEQLISDVFNTGGVTTLGSAADLVNAAVVAIDNLVTRTSDPLTVIDPTPGTHTITVDYDDNVPGIQCDTVISA